MKLPECNVREKLETFNQLKIFLYTLAAEYAPLFGSIFSFIEPRGHPWRVEMSFSGPAYRHGKPEGKWSLRVIVQTKYINTGTNHKKYHIFMDYQQEFPEDNGCCGHGPQRLIILGGMKFFHLEARPLSELYVAQASGNWPHMSVPLGLYLAKEYPDADIYSVEAAQRLIDHDARKSADESAAMMD